MKKVQSNSKHGAFEVPVAAWQRLVLIGWTLHEHVDTREGIELSMLPPANRCRADMEGLKRGRSQGAGLEQVMRC